MKDKDPPEIQSDSNERENAGSSSAEIVIDDRPQHQELQQTKAIPINEAIAFQSLINADINGKLRSLFQDPDLTIIPEPSNSNSNVRSSNLLQGHPQFTQGYTMNRPPYNPNIDFRRQSTKYPGNSFNPVLTSYGSPLLSERASTTTMSSPQLKNEEPQQISIGSSSLFQTQPISPSHEASASPHTSQANELSRHGSLPELKTLNIEKIPYLHPDEHDNEPDSSEYSPGEFSDSSSPVPVPKKKYKAPKGGVCSTCNKIIKRDLQRHQRTHEEVGRFKCIYPRKYCFHKSGFFNRQYDYKKHLLHSHFLFDDENVKKLKSLSDKLLYDGTCECGLKFQAGNWLDDHILISDFALKCPTLRRYIEEDMVERREQTNPLLRR